jgi:hypothetical protein
MDVKTLIDEANAYADKAIRQSYIEAKASRFREWITEPVIIYRLHFAVMTAFLAAFVLYEVIIY